jgi:hypothetical protein
MAQPAKSSFGSSFGIGCLSLIAANLTTNVLIFLITAGGGFGDVGSLLCINLFLLAGLSTAIIAYASRARQRKGQGPLNAGGIALAVGIFILIQILLIPLLQSAR